MLDKALQLRDDISAHGAVVGRGLPLRRVIGRELHLHQENDRELPTPAPSRRLTAAPAPSGQRRVTRASSRDVSVTCPFRLYKRPGPALAAEPVTSWLVWWWSLERLTMARVLPSGVLLLAALCWVGETADVCDLTKATGNRMSCLGEVMNGAKPDLATRIRQIDIPNWTGKTMVHEYQFTNIRLTKATDLRLETVTYTGARDANAKPRGFVASKEMKVKLEWPDIKLAMKAWVRVCLNGACHDMTAFPTSALTSPPSRRPGECGS